MKECPICRASYDDQTNFCLSDGATLIFTSPSFQTQSETPTVFANTPFVPQFQTPPPAPVKKGNGLLVGLLAGLLLLAVLAAFGGVGVYKLMKSRDEMTAASNKPVTKPAAQTPNDNGLSENLKRQQEKIDKDKEKLERERKELEAKKKEANKPVPVETPAAIETTTATIIDPPTNIRATPNGKVICVVRQRSTVNILGATGVRDSNGTWYYTDACGGGGVIHSSQIRF